MSTRERHHDRERPASPPPTDQPTRPPSAGGGGDAFLTAADAAINRALSGTPEQFLTQNRQLGGQ